MRFLANLFKKTITKVIIAFFFLLIVLLVVLFWEPIMKQCDKIAGMYYIHKGDKSFQKEGFQSAINYYNKGLNFYPSHSKARCNLGNIYVLYEDYFKAVDTYEEALKYNKKYILCRMNLGIILDKKLLDSDGAIDEYEKIIATRLPWIDIPYFYENRKTGKENKGIAYYNMGLAYRSKSMLAGEGSVDSGQNLVKAAESYKEAIKILKNDYNSYYNYGLVNHLLGNINEAEKAYCKAIEVGPLKYDAHYNLAILLRSLEMYRESLDELEKANLILDLEGDGNISRYVFDMINEVSQKLIIHENGTEYLVERFEKNFQQNSGITYISGKVVVAEDFDNAMLKNFSTCSVREYYKNKRNSRIE